MTGFSTAVQLVIRRVPSAFNRRDLLVGAWMLATVVAYYHNFLFLQSLALSYGYAFASYGLGLVYARYDTTFGIF